jgi:hypothetical protein
MNNDICYRCGLPLPFLKELTDEEILSCWDGVDLPEECWVTDEHRIDFARAILRKAQEK